MPDKRTCPLFYRPHSSSISHLAAVLVVVLVLRAAAFCGPIHDAACTGTLVRMGNQCTAELPLPSQAEVNVRHSFGKTPLYYAAQNGQREMAELLLDSKAGINARDHIDDITVMHLAAYGG